MRKPLDEHKVVFNRRRKPREERDGRARSVARGADHRRWLTNPAEVASPEVPAEIFPEECGFILSDGYGAEILREPDEHRLAAATRKAMMLRFARAGAARVTAAELAGIEVPLADGEAG